MINLIRFSCAGKAAVKSKALLESKNGPAPNGTLNEKLGKELDFTRKGSAKLSQKNIKGNFLESDGGYKLTVTPEQTAASNRYVPIPKDAYSDDQSSEMNYIDQTLLGAGVKLQQKATIILNKNANSPLVKGPFYEET